MVTMEWRFVKQYGRIRLLCGKKVVVPVGQYRIRTQFVWKELVGEKRAEWSETIALSALSLPDKQRFVNQYNERQRSAYSNYNSYARASNRAGIGNIPERNTTYTEKNFNAIVAEIKRVYQLHGRNI